MKIFRWFIYMMSIGNLPPSFSDDLKETLYAVGDAPPLLFKDYSIKREEINKAKPALIDISSHPDAVESSFVLQSEYEKNGTNYAGHYSLRFEICKEKNCHILDIWMVYTKM